MSKYNGEYEDIYSGREVEEAADKYIDVDSGRYAENTDNNGKFDSHDAEEIAYFSQKKSTEIYKKEAYQPMSNRHGGYEDVYSSKPSGKAGHASAKQPKKPKKKAKRALAWLLVIVLLLSGIGGYFAYALLDKINYVPSQHSNLYLDSSKLEKSRSVKNILFIGCDDDNGGAALRLRDACEH